MLIEDKFIFSPFAMHKGQKKRPLTVDTIREYKFYPLPMLTLLRGQNIYLTI